MIRSLVFLAFLSAAAAFSLSDLQALVTFASHHYTTPKRHIASPVQPGHPRHFCKNCTLATEKHDCGPYLTCKADHCLRSIDQLTLCPKYQPPSPAATNRLPVSARLANTITGSSKLCEQCISHSDCMGSTLCIDDLCVVDKAGPALCVQTSLLRKAAANTAAVVDEKVVKRAKPAKGDSEDIDEEDEAMLNRLERTGRCKPCAIGTECKTAQSCMSGFCAENEGDAAICEMARMLSQKNEGKFKPADADSFEESEVTVDINEDSSSATKPVKTDGFETEEVTVRKVIERSEDGEPTIVDEVVVVESRDDFVDTKKEATEDKMLTGMAAVPQTGVAGLDEEADEVVNDSVALNDEMNLEQGDVQLDVQDVVPGNEAEDTSARIDNAMSYEDAVAMDFGEDSRRTA